MGWGGSVLKWLPSQHKALDSNPYRRGVGTHSFIVECPDTQLDSKQVPSSDHREAGLGGTCLEPQPWEV